MDKVILVLNMLPEILNAVVAVLIALAALFMFIPGEQPEKSIHKIADFLAKFSKKKEKLEE